MYSLSGRISVLIFLFPYYPATTATTAFNELSVWWILHRLEEDPFPARNYVKTKFRNFRRILNQESLIKKNWKQFNDRIFTLSWVTNLRWPMPANTTNNSWNTTQYFWDTSQYLWNTKQNYRYTTQNYRNTTQNCRNTT